jgi:hypothetical protein
MAILDHNLIQEEIVRTIAEVNSMLKLDTAINGDYCPGALISSQILITVMGRIGKALGVIIPDNCYIFHDKKTQNQLTIKEATQKLIKVVENGN